MPGRVLVVEDDRKTADLVALYLRHAGLEVHVEHSGTGAQRRLATEEFDLLLLDVMLPGVDGLTLCREARQRGQTAIILLTARTQEDDRIAGLELGADDYIPKPFSPRELTARVQAVLRRVPPGAADILARGALRINLARRDVSVGNRTVELTASEFAILVALARRPGHVLSREQLLAQLPGDTTDTLDRTVDVHVRNLRRKIEPDAAAPRFVQTVVGAGYRLAPDAERVP